MDNLGNNNLFLIIAVLAVILWFTTSKAGRAQFESFTAQMQSGKYIPVIHGPSRRKWFHGSDQTETRSADAVGLSFPRYPGFSVVPPNRTYWKQFVDTICQMGIYYVVSPISDKKKVADDLLNQIYVWAQAHVDVSGVDDLWYFRDVVLNLDKIKSDPELKLSAMMLSESIGWLKTEAGRNRDCLAESIKSGNLKDIQSCSGIAPMVILGMMDKDTYLFDSGISVFNTVLTTEVQTVIKERFRTLKQQMKTYYTARRSMGKTLSPQNHLSLQTHVSASLDLVEQCCGILNDLFLATYALAKNKVLSANDPQLNFLKQCAATILVSMSGSGTMMAEYFANTGVKPAEMLGWVQLYYLLYVHKKSKDLATGIATEPTGLERDVDGVMAVDEYSDSKWNYSATEILHSNLAVTLEPLGMGGSVLHNFVI